MTRAGVLSTIGGTPLVRLQRLHGREDAKAAFVREHARTMNHPCGTCAMAADHADEGVVDATMRVKGARGLRVVDASVFVSIFLTLFCDVTRGI